MRSRSCRTTRGSKDFVNAVIHRSYSIAGDHIRVELFDDRICDSRGCRSPGIGSRLPRFSSSSPAIQSIVVSMPCCQQETREIVGALRDAGRLSTIKVADAIGLSRPVTIRRLSVLRDAGVVAWIGKSPKDPRAYWTLPPT